jgi:hypothetical protein
MSPRGPMPGYDEITKETLEEVLKSVTNQGYTTDLNLTGINLRGPALNLFPFLSPWRNRLPREMAAVGAKASQWRAITGINVTNQSIFSGFGAAGNLVSTTESDYTAAYMPISLGDSVQMDAEALARGFDNLRATSGTRLLYATMIKEDQALLGASNIALPTPTAPVVTAATTGGSIAASTVVNVKVSARTLVGYFNGGGTVYSAQGTVTTGSGTSTNSATALATAVPGAVAYDWTVAGFYYTTTTAPIVSITSIPGADQALASLPSLGGTVPTAASRATDSSADPKAFNGLLTSITQDYASNGSGQVTRGTGVSSGAYLKDLGGATLTGSQGGVTEIDDALQNLWDYYRISPTVMLVSSQQGRDITRKVVATGGATTMFDPDNVEQRRSVVGGQMLQSYLNPAVNGQPIEVAAMPHIPPGTIAMLTERLPYPDNNAGAVFDVECQQDYTQVEYAMSRGTGGGNLTGPRYDFEVRAIETFRNKFPAGCAVISGIGKG